MLWFWLAMAVLGVLILIGFVRTRANVASTRQQFEKMDGRLREMSSMSAEIAHQMHEKAS